MTIEEKKEIFLATCRDAISNLCYYDRKEDEDLTREDVKFLLENSYVTMDMMFSEMRKEILKNFKGVK